MSATRGSKEQKSTDTLQQQQQQRQLHNAMMQQRAAIERMQQVNAAAGAVPAAGGQAQQGQPLADPIASYAMDTSNSPHIYVNQNGQLMRVSAAPLAHPHAKRPFSVQNPFYNPGASSTCNKDGTPIQQAAPPPPPPPMRPVMQPQQQPQQPGQLRPAAVLQVGFCSIRLV